MKNKEELLKEIEGLSEKALEKLLYYAKDLKEEGRGKPIGYLAEFGTKFQLQDVEEMEKWIEEDCERIDRDEW